MSHSLKNKALKLTKIFKPRQNIDCVRKQIKQCTMNFKLKMHIQILNKENMCHHISENAVWP